MSETNPIDCIVSRMTPEERYAAHHFYTAVAEDDVPFCVGKKMRYRLRELGLMKWIGGNYFETTDLLSSIYPTLNGMSLSGFKRQQEAEAVLEARKAK